MSRMAMFNAQYNQPIKVVLNDIYREKKSNRVNVNGRFYNGVSFGEGAYTILEGAKLVAAHPETGPQFKDNVRYLDKRFTDASGQIVRAPADTLLVYQTAAQALSHQFGTRRPFETLQAEAYMAMTPKGHYKTGQIKSVVTVNKKVYPPRRVKSYDEIRLIEVSDTRNMYDDTFDYTIVRERITRPGLGFMGGQTFNAVTFREPDDRQTLNNFLMMATDLMDNGKGERAFNHWKAAQLVQKTTDPLGLYL